MDSKHAVSSSVVAWPHSNQRYHGLSEKAAEVSLVNQQANFNCCVRV